MDMLAIFSILIPNKNMQINQINSFRKMRTNMPTWHTCETIWLVPRWNVLTTSQEWQPK